MAEHDGLEYGSGSRLQVGMYILWPSRLLTAWGKTKLKAGQKGTSEITGRTTGPGYPGLMEAPPMHTKEGRLFAQSLSPFSWRRQTSPPHNSASF